MKIVSSLLNAACVVCHVHLRTELYKDTSFISKFVDCDCLVCVRFGSVQVYMIEMHVNGRHTIVLLWLH